MKYNGEPNSCETFSYGEVEDYTAVINNSFKAAEPETIKDSGSLSEIETGIYPNPASDIAFITINNADVKYYQLSVFDLQGKLVISDEVYSESNEILYPIHLEGIEKGIYLVTLKSNGNIRTVRLVVE